jgi:FixJ family two-component response regulator
VLLDLSMPGLSGEETFMRLREIDPDVRVLLSSGYNQTEVIRRFGDSGYAGFIQKPYDDVQLLDHLRRFMRRRPA